MLIRCYKQIKSFLLENNDILSKEVFSEIMQLILKSKNDDFIQNIFFLFDEEEKNQVDLKEMVIGLEIFRNDSYFTKMDSNYLTLTIVFIDLCDENDDGMIDVNEFKRILKNYLFDKRDLKIMPEISFNKLIKFDHLSIRKILRNKIKKCQEKSFLNLC